MKLLFLNVIYTCIYVNIDVYDNIMKAKCLSYLTCISFSGHADGVRSVSFSADGSKVVSGSSDQTIKIWNAYSDDVIQTLSGEIDMSIYILVYISYVNIYYWS